MVDVHSLSAADRIDLALTRIEAALADRPPAAPAPAGNPLAEGAASDSDLAERHAALKQRVAEAITALDTILSAGQSPGQSMGAE
ncbi:MAG: hypothetical protein K2W86_09185 [Sphingomonas sp.]|uniref:hypothetical protein n=1 Tax=Sphingomonas sp. TaxID=28214 RepID=UPI0035A8C1A0|nr:hypothetical protein [Sphingomonas sp.]